MTGGAFSQNAFRLRGTGFVVDEDGGCSVVGDFMFVNSCCTFCFSVVIVGGGGGCVWLVVVCIAGDFVPGGAGRFDGVVVFVLILVGDTEKAVDDFVVVAEGAELVCCLLSKCCFMSDIHLRTSSRPIGSLYSSP